MRRHSDPPAPPRCQAWWSLLEVARPGCDPVPYGILLADRDTGGYHQRLRAPGSLANLQQLELEEDEWDVLEALPADLERKAAEAGGLPLLDWLEDSASGFFRIGDRNSVLCNDARIEVDRLYARHVAQENPAAEVLPFVTHLPLYSLRAAATRFGEGMDVEQDGWVQAPEGLRLAEGMFVAYVVGRSMEPLIPDGSACIFRAPVTGSRKGRYLLIEQFDETDFAARYTVKRYARQGNLAPSADRDAAIRLEPLNREFEAFDLTGDRFRVVAEFVQVLPS